MILVSDKFSTTKVKRPGYINNKLEYLVRISQILRITCNVILSQSEFKPKLSALFVSLRNFTIGNAPASQYVINVTTSSPLKQKVYFAHKILWRKTTHVLHAYRQIAFHQAFSICTFLSTCEIYANIRDRQKMYNNILNL